MAQEELKEEAQKDNTILDKVINSMVNSFFDKEKLIILGIFILGFILRIIAANNLGVSPDDMGHAFNAIGIFDSNKLNFWGQSTILWYYIEGVFLNLFGITTLSSRFATVLLGSFTVIMMYIFTKKLFKSKNAAIISSFLIAVSPILIKETLPEMDVAVCFFVSFAAYFLFDYLQTKSNKKLIFSALLLGTGIMIKLYVLFFAISFIIFLIYKEIKDKTDNKKIIYNIIIFGAIITFLVIPTLVHNYLLYKDKGFMDLIFTNTLKLGVDKAKIYYESGAGAGWMSYSDYKGFLIGNQRNFAPNPLPGFLLMLWEIFISDPILFIFGSFGLTLLAKRKIDYFWFYLIVFLPAFIYLGAQIPMAKHFIWSLALAAPAAGYLVGEIMKRSNKLKIKYIILIILIFNLIWLGQSRTIGPASFYGKDGFNQLVSLKETIPANSLIIIDSRIYRASIHWGFAGTNYIEAGQFIPIIPQINNATNTVMMDVYYVECVRDDCGWGTVKNQPEFNKTMEEFTRWFAEQSNYKKEFYGPNSYKYYLPGLYEKELQYAVHKITLPMPPEIIPFSTQTHIWLLNPAGYNRSILPIFDDYQIKNTFDRMLNSFAFKVIYFEIILSFVAIIYLIYLFLFGDNK